MGTMCGLRAASSVASRATLAVSSFARIPGEISGSLFAMAGGKYPIHSNPPGFPLLSDGFCIVRKDHGSPRGPIEECLSVCDPRGAATAMRFGIADSDTEVEERRRTLNLKSGQ